MKVTPKFIDEKGFYQPQKSKTSIDKHLSNLSDSKYSCLMHAPLKYLIENNYVFQDENKDWILVEYCPGEYNDSDWVYWVETGYKRCWQVCRWKSDANQDELFTLYSQETSWGWDRKYFRVQLNNHVYKRIIHPKHEKNNYNGYWVEVVDRIDNCNQLYYKSFDGYTSGKMPVKIGRKIQELRDQKIEFGFYKF